MPNCETSGSSWHGTRVAGMIGALTNNSAGVAGLDWNSFILPVRVLGKCGGIDSDILAGHALGGRPARRRAFPTIRRRRASST